MKSANFWILINQSTHSCSKCFVLEKYIGTTATWVITQRHEENCSLGNCFVLESGPPPHFSYHGDPSALANAAPYWHLLMAVSIYQTLLAQVQLICPTFALECSRGTVARLCATAVGKWWHFPPKNFLFGVIKVHSLPFRELTKLQNCLRVALLEEVHSLGFLRGKRTPLNSLFPLCCWPLLWPLCRVRLSFHER